MTASPGASPGPPNLLALKILVVVMGIAIVAGVIVIVVAVSNRMSDSETLAPAGAAGTTGPVTKADSVAIGDLSIAVPEGCVMADAGVEGNRLIVRLDGLAERGCQQVILIDLSNGTVLGRVTAEPGP